MRHQPRNKLYDHICTVQYNASDKGFISYVARANVMVMMVMVVSMAVTMVMAMHYSKCILVQAT